MLVRIHPELLQDLKSHYTPSNIKHYQQQRVTQWQGPYVYAASIDHFHYQTEQTQEAGATAQEALGDLMK